MIGSAVSAKRASTGSTETVLLTLYQLREVSEVVVLQAAQPDAVSGFLRTPARAAYASTADAHRTRTS